MATPFEQLATQAAALSAADRERLAELLMASLPDDAGRADEGDQGEVATQDQELQRRVASVESGTARLVAAADVHARARKLCQR